MRLPKPILATALLGVAVFHAAPPGHAQGTTGAAAVPSAAELFKDADIALGEKLIAEHKCTQCHVSKVGGDGSKMYKPQGKFNNAGLLRGMVEMCNTQMNLGLFPEEVTAVAAVLNRDHYKFK